MKGGVLETGVLETAGFQDYGLDFRGSGKMFLKRGRPRKPLKHSKTPGRTPAHQLSQERLLEGGAGRAGEDSRMIIFTQWVSLREGSALG